MFLIQSISQTQSGRRDEAVKVMKEFAADAHKECGLPPQRILTASIGPADSTIIMEGTVASLAEFEQTIDRINKWSGMQRYGQKFAELFISGSHRFEVYRVHT
jgi:hypothetical protein